MNEVQSTTVGSTAINRTTSLKGSIDPKAEQSGKRLPEAASVAFEKSVAEAQEAKSPQESVDVENALTSMNEYVQSIQRDLQFTVDAESERTVIKVMDGGSGELIRQIPEEVFLELARKLNDDGEFQLIDAIG